MADNTDSMKVCTRCTFTCSYDIAYTHFNRSKSRKDGYNGWCKACLKEWRIKNADSQKEKRAKYFQENKEEINRKKQEYRRKHPEKRRALDRKYRREHREQRNAYNRELRKQNRQAFIDAHNRYLDRKAAQPDNFTEDDWNFCVKYWKNSCAVCGKKRKLYRDHWIAVSAEVDDHPGNQPCNILCLCKSCNSSKFNKDGFEWMVDIYGNVQAKEIYVKIQAYFKLVGERDISDESHNAA